MRILIFGGDERQIFAATYLKRIGADVGIFAIDIDTLKLYGADIFAAGSYTGFDKIVFPLPFSKDGVNINCPFSKVSYNAVDIFRTVEKGTSLFAGMIGTFYKNVAREYGHNITDYYESEAFQIKNAVPTAEGAVWTYMNNSKKTVFGSEFTVTGCGKVGKCLADRLQKLGGNVTVAARSERDLAWAVSMGMRAVSLDKFLASNERCDCIFNTVPSNIFNKKFVGLINKETIYIELASKPFGMNKECEEMLGNRHIYAPSLPGKTAPVTAGTIIAETIAKYI